MTGILGGLIGSFKTAVAGVVTKYFASVQSSTPKHALVSVATDSNQNTYYATKSGSTSRAGFLLIKKAKDGSIVWVKNISTGYTTTNVGDSPNGIRVIGSDLWAWGVMRQNIGVTSGNNSWLIKFDLNGNIVSQWYQNWSTSSLNSEIIRFNIDSSGYFHMTFFDTYDKSVNYYDLIFNSSLVAVKQRYYSYGQSLDIKSRPSDGTVFYFVQNDGFGFNLVTPGTAPTTDTRYKYTTSETPINSFNSSGFTFDSSGNIYVTSFTVGTNGYTSAILLSKFNTSLTHQWTRRITTGTTVIRDTYLASLTIDSSDNLYLSLRYAFYSTIFKYNSSGTLQWKSRIVFTSGANTATEMAPYLYIDSNNDLVMIASQYQYFPDGIALKIKSDGSMADNSLRTIPGTSPALAVRITADTTYTDAAYSYVTAFSAPPSGYITYQNYTAAFTTTMPYTVTNTDITASYTENQYLTT